MQISRYSLLAGVIAPLIFPLAASFAKDNEVQIKARQALEQRMNELSAQSAAIQPEPAPVQPTEPAPQASPAPVPAPAPAAAPAVAPAEPKAAPPAAPEAVATEWPQAVEPSNQTDSKALEDAVRQKIDQLKGAQSTPVPEPVPVPTQPPPAVPPAPPAPVAPPVVAAPPSPAPAPPPPVEQPMPPAAPAPAAATAADDAKWGQVEMPPPKDHEQQDKFQQALQQKISELKGQPAAPAAVVVPEKAGSENEAAMKAPAIEPDQKPAPKAQAPAAAQTEIQPKAQPKAQPTTAVNKSQLPPLPAPPSAISASKEQRLRDLFQQYLTDAISPERYHEERAKILAEP